MLPEIPELPSIKTVGNPKITKPAMPGMDRLGTMSSGRQQEAKEYAAAMGRAFAITKSQNKIQKAKARVRGRQSQSAAENRKRR